jgi:hypothetical protein
MALTGSAGGRRLRASKRKDASSPAPQTNERRISLDAEKLRRCQAAEAVRRRWCRAAAFAKYGR